MMAKKSTKETAHKRSYMRYLFPRLNELYFSNISMYALQHSDRCLNSAAHLNKANGKILYLCGWKVRLRNSNKLTICITFIKISLISKK